MFLILDLSLFIYDLLKFLAYVPSWLLLFHHILKSPCGVFSSFSFFLFVCMLVCYENHSSCVSPSAFLTVEKDGFGQCVPTWIIVD